MELDGLYASGELAGLAAQGFADCSGKGLNRYPDNDSLAALVAESSTPAAA